MWHSRGPRRGKRALDLGAQLLDLVLQAQCLGATGAGLHGQQSKWRVHAREAGALAQRVFAKTAFGIGADAGVEMTVATFEQIDEPRCGA